MQVHNSETLYFLGVETFSNSGVWFAYQSSKCSYHCANKESPSVVSDSFPMECSLPGSSVHGISRQEHWSGGHFLLQGVFPTQGSTSGLLHCNRMLYHLSHQGNPAKERTLKEVK